MRINKGFTLIELLVVIAILGTLATLVIIRFSGAQETARDSRRQSDLKQYQTALEVYANRSNQLYPVRTSTVNIATNLCTVLNLENCPLDPRESSSFFYRYQSNSSGMGYVLWALLERRNVSGVSEFFVLCSNGKVGKISSTIGISNGNCPL